MTSRIDVPGVAIVSGSGSGIGRAIVFSFIRQGCTQIALLDRNDESLQRTKALIEAGPSPTGKPVKVGMYKCDVTSPEAIEAAYKAAKEDFGRVDYSVQCAAYTAFPTKSVDTSLEVFEKHVNTTYRGQWLCAREAIKIMRSQTLDSEAYPDAQIPAVRGQRGAIVNISSSLANLAQRNFAPYCGAKSAILGITRADAIDYVDDRIRVNAVLPGLTDTPSTVPTPEVRAWLEANPLTHTPMRRFAVPDEIADACVFLCGTSASFITGASIVADGGFLAGHP